MGDIDITLFLVGQDKDDAQTNFPFDSYDSAKSYRDDNPGTKIWSVSASIDFSTMEEE